MIDMWPTEDAVRRRFGEGGVALLRELERVGPSALTVHIVGSVTARPATEGDTAS